VFTTTGKLCFFVVVKTIKFCFTQTLNYNYSYNYYITFVIFHQKRQNNPNYKERFEKSSLHSFFLPLAKKKFVTTFPGHIFGN